MKCALGLLLIVYAAAATTPNVVYRIDTIAGSASIGDGGPATAAQIGNIQGIAIDRQGNQYISDTDHNLVRRIDIKGVITTIAGAGAAGYGGDNGSATAALINLPYGLAADLAGNVYIADLGNNRVRRVGADGSITTVAGTGLKGSLGDGGLAANAQLNTPRNVAVDAAGNLYIAEFEGHRIRRVTPDGKIATVAGTGVAGFFGDGGLAVNAQLAYPAGLALDRAGNLYFADSQNQRIREILPGGIISTVLGGSSTITLLTPVTVALDAYGDIFYADSTDIVHVYTTVGAWVIVAGTGAPGFAGDGGLASKALLTNPRDLALDLAGDLFIADGIHVREVNQGIIETVAGDGFLHAVGDGSLAAIAILNQPLGVALDRAGNLYIADTGTQRIRIVGPSGIINTVAGTGVGGYASDNVPAAAAELNSPMGVMTDAYGAVYIADTYNHRIREAVANGIITTFAGTGTGSSGPQDLLAAQTQLRGPRGVCTGLTGVNYIVDTSNHRVLRVPPGGLVETVAGNGTPGLAGDGGPGRTAELNQPDACAVDSAGNLFIADTLNHRIAKVSAASGIITTVAGTGQAGVSADGIAAVSAALNTPRGLAVDDNGDIFIADTGNNLIRQVMPDGTIYTIAGQAAGGFGGDTGVALAALLNAPAGIVEDGSGALYFADTNNNRVRRLTPQAAPPPVTAPVVALPAVAPLNGASLVAGPIAPGEILTIYGSGIGPQQGMPAAFNSSGLLANLLGGSAVLFDGLAAPLFYAQAGQINVQAPYTIAQQTTTHVAIQYLAQTVAVSDLPVAAATPGVFPVIVNPDGSLNSSSNPAPQSGILTFYATGEGVTNGANVAGLAAASPFATPLLVVAVSIGGQPAALLYAGAAPGLVGMLQVDVQAPAGTASGAAILQLTVGTVAAPAVTFWMQ